MIKRAARASSNNVYQDSFSIVICSTVITLDKPQFNDKFNDNTSLIYGKST